MKFCTDSNSGCSIVYSTISPSDVPQRHILFLLAAYPSRPTPFDIAQLGRTLGMFGMSVNQDLFAQAVTVDNLARFARRSYPNYLVYYPEIWHQLEQDTGANLALSGEEEELLRRVHFPAFLNDRAGSGKSTMLHYAFAYYCNLYLQQINDLNFNGTEEIFYPLFLTYSDRLTSRARDVVLNIITSHVRYLDNSRLYPSNWQDQLSDCFQSFQAFLLPEGVTKGVER